MDDWRNRVWIGLAVALVLVIAFVIALQVDDRASAKGGGSDTVANQRAAIEQRYQQGRDAAASMRRRHLTPTKGRCITWYRGTDASHYDWDYPDMERAGQEMYVKGCLAKP